MVRQGDAATKWFLPIQGSFRYMYDEEAAKKALVEAAGGGGAGGEGSGSGAKATVSKRARGSVVFAAEAAKKVAASAGGGWGLGDSSGKEKRGVDSSADGNSSSSSSSKEKGDGLTTRNWIRKGEVTRNCVCARVCHTFFGVFLLLFCVFAIMPVFDISNVPAPSS
jgi:hypothetical protein